MAGTDRDTGCRGGSCGECNRNDIPDSVQTSVPCTDGDCPQRACCTCLDAGPESLACTLLRTTDVDEANAMCAGFCTMPGVFSTLIYVADKETTNFCASGGACFEVDCPLSE